MQYSTDIIYISGSKNVVADCLFQTQRNALFKELPTISLHKTVAKQQADASTNSALSDSNNNIVGDVSHRSCWLIIFKTMHKQVFDAFHSLSYLGIRATRSLIKEQSVWK